MKILRAIPNILTALRLCGTVSLLFVEPISGTFFVIYTACGITDVLDGAIARAAHCTSEMGAKLDSIADLSLYTVMALRVLPMALKRLRKWVWYWFLAVVVIRVGVYLLAAFKHRRFSSLHTWLNKATGFAFFLLPYALGWNAFYPYSIAGCGIASLATAEELAIHLKSKTYDPDKKSLLA